MYEVTNRTQGPYSAICYVRCTWSDGTVTSGSGVVVGPNDVLTALHVVTPSGLKTLRSLYVAPGADTSPLSFPYGSFNLSESTTAWINRRASNWDLNGDGLLNSLESSMDMAVIGFDSNIAAQSGSLATSATASDFTGQIVGFPGQGTGMMAEQVSARASLWTYEVAGMLGPGSSGGPLLKTGTDGKPYVVGIASGGDAATNTSAYSALFAPGNAAWLASAIAGNDHLIRVPVSAMSGGYGGDLFSLDSAKPAGAGVTLTDFGGDDLLTAFSQSKQTISMVPGTSFTVGGVVFTIAAGTMIERARTGWGSDTVVGNSADNGIQTNEGRDTLTGLGGADALEGGLDIDTAVFTGLRADYTLNFIRAVRVNGYEVTPARTIVIDRLSSRDGTDTLTSIERLKFSDTMLALDVLGNAGSVARLLGAVFGKAAVANKAYVGFGLAMLDGGMSYAALAQAAVNAKLGAAPGHAQVVELLYTNLVGSAPGAADLAAYTRLLDSRAETPATLAMLAADSPANLVNINYTGLAANGLEYTLA